MTKQKSRFLLYHPIFFHVLFLHLKPSKLVTLVYKVLTVAENISSHTAQRRIQKEIVKKDYYSFSDFPVPLLLWWYITMHFTLQNKIQCTEDKLQIKETF